MSSTYDIAVVGAGPAGIMAAVSAATTGSKVVLLEKNEVIGRKILATGNGRCNISNRNITLDRYHGSDVPFAEPILASFDATEYFESLGVLLKEEDRGRLFPGTNQASTVVDALKAELDRLSIQICTDFTVKKLEPGKIWQIANENGQSVTAKKVILTTGGKAAHQFGSSGDGLFWARNFGHTIIPIHAALVPIETKEAFVKDIMGIKLVAKTTLIADGKEMEHRTGDILFTHFGVSGPAAMGLAGTASQFLAEGKDVIISIDMVPDIEKDALDDIITKQASEDGKKAIKTILLGLVPKNLVSHILATVRIKEETKAAEISKSQRRDIVSALKDFRLTASKVRPLKEAQVTAGGVATAEVKATLESKLVPNLYFAGEILDIDGDSGGFNLQWAWSSGKVAGEAAGRSHD